MQLKSDRDQLLDALQIASRALSTRSTLPSLGGIMLTSESGTPTLRATDTELAVTVTVAGELEGEGSILLPGRLLTDLVKTLPPGQISLSERSSENDVELTAGTANCHLRVLAADDFPNLPGFEGDIVKMPAAAFAETVENVARAASRDEVRPILTGILVSVDGDHLTMVATDSYRLAVKHTKLESPVGTAFEANVPARALRELARLVVAAGVEEIELVLTGSQIVFRAGNVTLSSRLIDGQFPSYRQLVPEAFDHDVRLPKSELLDVLRRIRHFAQRTAPLRMAFAEGEVTIAATTPEVGDASEAMPCSYDGEAMEIAFNPQYLVEGVESIEGEEVVLRLTSPLRPGLLQPAGDESYSYLVMPIRLNV